jgi:lysophospholipase L1-like esterase
MKTVNIAFWGDSITEGIPGCSYFKQLQLDPNHYRLHNYGKGGDTVISLYNRLRNQELDNNYGMVFLLVGVNDVFVKLAWWYAMIKTVAHQPWSQNDREFETYYRKILALLAHKSKTVIAVSPLFLGEDLNNPWNAQLSKQREIIANLKNQFDNVEYMNIYNDDLKPVLVNHQLENQHISNYLPKSGLRIVLDVLLVKHPDQMAETSKKRGLFLTLDGVHLNDRGAHIVAQTFTERIEKIGREGM